MCQNFSLKHVRAGLFTFVLVIVVQSASAQHFTGDLFYVPNPNHCIAKVYEYTPAPGQYINHTSIGSPDAAVQSIIGSVTGTLSLGAFGGYVVFAFAQPVANDSSHCFGVDFTIFGNAQQAYGYERVTWSEPGAVYVMRDDNGNGEPDDTWYELAGSDYRSATTIKNYRVTYVNPGGNAAADVQWYDNRGQSGVVQANTYHSQTYYPRHDLFPHIPDTAYTLQGTFIAPDVDTSDQSFVISWGRKFGYADNQIRGAEPFTTPDNPFTPQVENAGGDAFDISWAVDSTGKHVDLDTIHFVKVMTCTQANMGWMGEISTEIAGAVLVMADDFTGVPLPPERELLLYPNPAVDFFAIRGAQGARVRVFALSGRQFVHVDCYEGGPLDVGDLPKGVYIVEIQLNSRLSRAKLLVK